MKQMDENSFSLPRPNFETTAANKYIVRYAQVKQQNKDRTYCQISLVGGVAKRQARRKLEKIPHNVNINVYAKKWKNKNHKYCKVFGFVDRENSDENLAPKFCKAIFFKDSSLNSQPFIPSTLKESETLSTPDVSSTDKSSDFRKKSRQGLQYKFNQADIKCIIATKINIRRVDQVTYKIYH